MLAVVEAGHASRTGGPTVPGWVGAGESIWWRILTAADISAGGVNVRARMRGMAVYTGSAGIGRTTQQNGVKTQPGGAAYIRGWTGGHESGIGPSTGRLGLSVKWPDDGHWHATWSVLSPSGGYVSISEDGDAQGYRGLEILPAAAPAPPTLASPEAGGYVSAAGAVSLSWVPTPTVAGAVPDGYRVYIRVTGAGTWSYLTSGGTITASGPVSVTGSATSATIAAGQLTAGVQYEWLVYTSEGGLWSAASTSRTFTAVADPVVTSVSVSSPLNDLTPTVSWSVTTSVGSQTAYQVDVVQGGLVVGSSGLLSGAATSWTVYPAREDWVNGGSYQARVTVWQTGGVASAPVSTGFSPSWTPPTAPASVAGADGSPLQVTVTGIGSGLGVQIQSQRPGGAWETVATEPAPSGTYQQGIPLAPYGVAVTYRARTYSVLEGVRLWSSWVTSVPVSSTDAAAYLVSDDGSQWLRVTIEADDDRDLVQGVSVSYGFGAARAQVDSGPVQGKAGSTVLRTDTAAELDAVQEWLTTRPVWWLRWHPEGSLVSDAPVDQAATRMALAASLSESRLALIPISKRHTGFRWVTQ